MSSDIDTDAWLRMGVKVETGFLRRLRFDDIEPLWRPASYCIRVGCTTHCHAGFAPLEDAIVLGIVGGRLLRCRDGQI